MNWKSLSEKPAEIYNGNPSMSPYYLVKCEGTDNIGNQIIGYSFFSYSSDKWMDCYRATEKGMHKVIAWTDEKL